jgi:hypothetical protein
MPIAKPSVGSTNKIDESNRLKPYDTGSSSQSLWYDMTSRLDGLNKRLNVTWTVNVIDKSGVSHILISGEKGRITFKYDTDKKKWEVEIWGISDNEVRQIIETDPAKRVNEKREIKMGCNYLICKLVGLLLTRRSEDATPSRILYDL